MLLKQGDAVLLHASTGRVDLPSALSLLPFNDARPQFVELPINLGENPRLDTRLLCSYGDFQFSQRTPQILGVLFDGPLFWFQRNSPFRSSRFVPLLSNSCHMSLSNAFGGNPTMMSDRSFVPPQPKEARRHRWFSDMPLGGTLTCLRQRLASLLV